MSTVIESANVSELDPRRHEFDSVPDFVDAMEKAAPPITISDIEYIEQNGRKAAVCTASDGQFYVLDAEDGCVVPVYDSDDKEDAKDIAARYLKACPPVE